MSADSTEITFVRCPSCRSLVPAASTRCRMCGAKLDTAAQSSEGDSSDKNRRVRQRTISDEQSDMVSAVEQIRCEAADEPAVEVRSEEVASEQSAAVQETVEADEAQTDVRAAIAEAAEDDDFEDPLSDYLEDMDEEEELLDDDIEDFLAADDEALLDDDELQGESASEAGIVEKPEEAGIKAVTPPVQIPPIVPPIEAPKVSTESDVRKEDATPVSEILSVQEPVDKAVSVPLVASPSGSQERSVERQEDPNVSVTGNEAPLEEQPVMEVPVKKESPKPRVVLESGSGRHKGGGLSFGKKKEVQERGPAQTFATPEKQTLFTAKARVEEKVGVSAEEGVSLKKGPVKYQEEGVVKEGLTIGGEKKMETPDAFGRPLNLRQSQPGESVKPDEVKKGRLVGWLVNYSDSSGTSVELREGRYFVTRDGLKPSDLIIDDPSISTPHALIIVGANGVMVQDLMSDRGVFNRSRDEDTYRREIDPFRTDHGDWVRFGDVEFLVSLIAHVGVK